MSATVQTSLFDFKPIERPRAEPPRVRITDRYEDGGYYRVFRTDALSIVNSLGRPFDGRGLSDTRILDNNYHGKTVNGMYFYSTGRRDEDHPIHSFLQCASYIFKLINDEEILDVLNLTEYDKDKHTYNNDYRHITSAWLDGDLLCIDTEDGGKFSIGIKDDSGIDPYRISDGQTDPTIYTEGLVNEALKAGVPMADLEWYLGSYAYSVRCYRPFTRDLETGEMIRSIQFEQMCALADRLGIVLSLSQNVPKPQPDRWGILPCYRKTYCARSKGCKEKDKCGGCVCCDRFLYNRQPVKKTHLDIPGRKSSTRGCDPEECE